MASRHSNLRDSDDSPSNKLQDQTTPQKCFSEGSRTDGSEEKRTPKRSYDDRSRRKLKKVRDYFGNQRHNFLEESYSDGDLEEQSTEQRSVHFESVYSEPEKAGDGEQTPDNSREANVSKKPYLFPVPPANEISRSNRGPQITLVPLDFSSTGPYATQTSENPSVPQIVTQPMTYEFGDQTNLNYISTENSEPLDLSTQGMFYKLPMAQDVELHRTLANEQKSTPLVYEAEYVPQQHIGAYTSHDELTGRISQTVSSSVSTSQSDGLNEQKDPNTCGLSLLASIAIEDAKNKPAVLIPHSFIGTTNDLRSSTEPNECSNRNVLYKLTTITSNSKFSEDKSIRKTIPSVATFSVNKIHEEARTKSCEIIRESSHETRGTSESCAQRGTCDNRNEIQVETAQTDTHLKPQFIAQNPSEKLNIEHQHTHEICDETNFPDILIEENVQTTLNPLSAIETQNKDKGASMSYNAETEEQFDQHALNFEKRPGVNSNTTSNICQASGNLPREGGSVIQFHSRSGHNLQSTCASSSWMTEILQNNFVQIVNSRKERGPPVVNMFDPKTKKHSTFPPAYDDAVPGPSGLNYSKSRSNEISNLPPSFTQQTHSKHLDAAHVIGEYETGTQENAPSGEGTDAHLTEDFRNSLRFYERTGARPKSKLGQRNVQEQSVETNLTRNTDTLDDAQRVANMILEITKKKQMEHRITNPLIPSNIGPTVSQTPNISSPKGIKLPTYSVAQCSQSNSGIQLPVGYTQRKTAINFIKASPGALFLMPVYILKPIVRTSQVSEGGQLSLTSSQLSAGPSQPPFVDTAPTPSLDSAQPSKDSDGTLSTDATQSSGASTRTPSDKSD